MAKKTASLPPAEPTRRAQRYWLFKTEPDSYSIDDLKRDGTTGWDGVRNHQARNLLRDDVQVGDYTLIYHSSVEPMGIAGVGTITGAARADPTAMQPKSPYFDPRSTKETPIWMLVDVAFTAKFDRFVPLSELKADPTFVDMLVCKRGSRLSIQPVAETHFAAVCRLGGWEGWTAKMKSKGKRK